MENGRSLAYFNEPENLQNLKFLKGKCIYSRSKKLVYYKINSDTVNNTKMFFNVWQHLNYSYVFILHKRELMCFLTQTAAESLLTFYSLRNRDKKM